MHNLCCKSNFCCMTRCGDQGKTHNQCCTSDFCNMARCGDQGKIHNQCCTSDFCNMAGCCDQGTIINQCCPSDFCYMPWCGDQNTPKPIDQMLCKEVYFSSGGTFVQKSRICLAILSKGLIKALV